MTQGEGQKLQFTLDRARHEPFARVFIVGGHLFGSLPCVLLFPSRPRCCSPSVSARPTLQIQLSLQQRGVSCWAMLIAAVSQPSAWSVPEKWFTASSSPPLGIRARRRPRIRVSPRCSSRPLCRPKIPTRFH